MSIIDASNPKMVRMAQLAVVVSIFTGIRVMLVVAVVSLTLATMNWIVSILATLYIGGIISMLLDVLQPVG